MAAIKIIQNFYLIECILLITEIRKPTLIVPFQTITVGNMIRLQQRQFV